MLTPMSRLTGHAPRLASIVHRLARLGRRSAPILLVAAALLPLLMAADALGQAENPVAPPEPGEIRGGFPVWIAYVSMLALTAVVLFVGLFPSKRGHQD